MSPPPSDGRLSRPLSSTPSQPSFSVFSLRDYGGSAITDPAAHPPVAPSQSAPTWYQARYPNPQQQHQHRQNQQAAMSGPQGDAAEASRPHEVAAHRVYNLACRHCSRFFSDRGMRAVLLLRPSIVLFSSDAQPINTAPFPAYDDCHNDVERTCLCLTQSLACCGCGTVCGYNIIRPCTRCIDSVSHQARSSNNHRYVFHADEIISTERRYVPGEPSVLPPRFSRSRHGSPVEDYAASASHLAVPAASSAEPGEDRVMADVYPKLDHGRGSGANRPLPAASCDRRHDGRSHGRAGCSPGLREGDVLFWHNLKSSGEQPNVVDPSRRVRSRPAR